MIIAKGFRVYSFQLGVFLKESRLSFMLSRHYLPVLGWPLHHRGTPTIKGTLYLIIAPEICHKIKYAKRRTLGRPVPTHHVRPAAYAAGRGNNKGRKGDKRVRLATRTAFNSTPTRSPMLRSQYDKYSHRNNFRDGAAPARRAGTTRREAEDLREQARLADTVIHQLKPRSTDTVPHI
ncbi:hypothetical protein JTE90_012431 [Oedothorax gibbosus]|uniref:Uncharacterized protein n=1 Tax=Oedothorax gibbosus TaxID=931172 RepID=A0AAV6TDA8_9ARAC|nr:hypothetical protein JTE90_012431 [Oedothorax gibbosus]